MNCQISDPSAAATGLQTRVALWDPAVSPELALSRGQDSCERRKNGRNNRSITNGGYREEK